MSTLYRTYRPQTFAETLGQNYIKIILEHQISTGHLAHAFMFCGPRAVGKTTLARVMAKAVNCLNRKEGESEPCGVCDACVDISAGRSLDVVEIDAASHTGVDNVREHVIASARIAPSRLKKKVFIIDEVHMLSSAAFNALLKTLEEPPANVLFILCTTEIHKVPLTIISRCQRFDFKRIGLNDVVKKLQYIINKEGIVADKKILEAVARHADGHMRDAESLLGQLVNVGGKEITQEEAGLVIPRSDLVEVLKLIGLIADKNGSDAIRLVNKLVDEGIDLRVFVTDMVETLRKMMLIKINPSLLEFLSLEMGESLELDLNKIKDKLTIEQIVFLIEQLIKAGNEIKHSFIAQMPLELVIAKVSVANSQAIARAGSLAVAKSVQPEAAASQDQNMPPAPAILSDGQVEFATVLERWNEFLIRVKKYNHSLSFILKVCQPRSINGTELCVAFKYKFHKDRVTDPNIKNLIDRVLSETYGANISMEAIIDDTLEIDTVATPNTEEPPATPQTVTSGPEQPEIASEAPKGDNEMLDNLLKTFGGKVVS